MMGGMALKKSEKLAPVRPSQDERNTFITYIIY